MPICFLVTRNETIVFEDKKRVQNFSELEENVRYQIQEFEDIYGWNFEIKEDTSKEGIFIFEDKSNVLELRVYLEQSTLIEGSHSAVIIED